MSHPYSPSPVTLTTLTVPDDGDPRTAASVNGPMQQLADGLFALAAAAITPVVVEYDSNGTFTAPSNALPFAILEGCGGGGGGGGGGGNPGADAYASGGGGGGGAMLFTRVCTIYPGEAHTVTIGSFGSGGTAGTAGNAGGDGSPGSTTIFQRTSPLTNLAKFRGAGGGHGGQLTPDPVTLIHGLGGSSIAPASTEANGILLSDTLRDYYRGCSNYAQFGAHGITSNNTQEEGYDGGPSPEGFTGNSSGTSDTSASGSYHGGGRGGAGGSGPYASGGTGGDGGSPNNAGGGSGGTAGLSAQDVGGAGASPNSGAGGGGGGAAGGATGTSVAGLGKSGSNGRLRILYFTTA